LLAATVIIPARYASTRFPRKMLAADTGRPLVQHVVDQVRKCGRVSAIVVATDDQRIAEALRPFETEVRMTSLSHQSGTDRIWEVAEKLGAGSIVLNVQGDEPEIEPETVDRLIEAMGDGHQMGTAAAPFPSGADPNDPNLVKVVIGLEDQALYFSRAAIPFPRDRDSESAAAYHLHLGIYAYRWELLRDFVSWQPTPLERTEKLEQLRALEHGVRIRVLKVARGAHGIDTEEQYKAFVSRVRK